MPMSANGALEDAAPAAEPHTHRALAVWLLAVAALIVAMVVLGGVTRLTHSGLSMVEWRPATGWLPPLSEAAWQAEFESYKQYPEYRKLNRGMALADFQAIYAFEYSHRLLGRLIGLAFLVPFLWFWWRRRLERALAPRLAVMFVLGGLQGVLGWYMVKSGLVERPDVSQYRLSAHLGLAVLILGFMLWTALDILTSAEHYRARQPGGPGLGLLALIFVMILSGGLVAGLDAGFLYNSFPLMGERWIAPEAFADGPWWRAMLEDPVTAQFDHRLLALVVSVAVIAYAWRARAALPGQWLPWGLLGALALQVLLGIATLVYVVPVALAAAHQAGALVLLGAALATIHAVSRKGEAR